MGHEAALSEVIQQAEAVKDLKALLADMGITCSETLQSSIESETDFVEAIVDLLKVEGEIDAQMEGLSAYIATLTARKAKMAEAKNEIRAGLARALKRSGEKKIPTAFGTVYTKSNPPKLKIVSEADVPETFYHMQLDQTELRKALVDRDKRLEEAKKKAKTPEELLAILAKFNAEDPPIPGAELQEQEDSIGVRRK